MGWQLFQVIILLRYPEEGAGSEIIKCRYGLHQSLDILNSPFGLAHLPSYIPSSLPGHFSNSPKVHNASIRALCFRQNALHTDCLYSTGLISQRNYCSSSSACCKISSVNRYWCVPNNNKGIHLLTNMLHFALRSLTHPWLPTLQPAIARGLICHMKEEAGINISYLFYNPLGTKFMTFTLPRSPAVFSFH